MIDKRELNIVLKIRRDGEERERERRRRGEVEVEVGETVRRASAGESAPARLGMYRNDDIGQDSLNSAALGYMLDSVIIGKLNTHIYTLLVKCRLKSTPAAAKLSPLSISVILFRLRFLLCLLHYFYSSSPPPPPLYYHHTTTLSLLLSSFYSAILSQSPSLPLSLSLSLRISPSPFLD